MSRTGERYNIRDCEARWQAEWRRGTLSADAAMVVRLRHENDDALSQARACVLGDAVVRYRRARGEAASLRAPTNAAFLGLAWPLAQEERENETARNSNHTLDTGAVLRQAGDEPDDLDAVIDTYGADALRLHLLSDVPPDRPLTWRSGGIDGAWRYVHRLWRLVADRLPALPAPGTPVPATLSAPARAVRQRVARTILAVTAEMDGRRFHKAMARLRALGHLLAALPVTEPGAAWVLRNGLEALVRMAAPLLPHLGAELRRALGLPPLTEPSWPNTDPALLNEEAVTVAVQVNGKRRGELRLPRDASQQTLQRTALALPAVVRHIGGLPPRKVIVVPNRILNVVV